MNRWTGCAAETATTSKNGSNESCIIIVIDKLVKDGTPRDLRGVVRAGGADKGGYPSGKSQISMGHFFFS